MGKEIDLIVAAYQKVSDAYQSLLISKEALVTAQVGELEARNNYLNAKADYDVILK